GAESPILTLGLHLNIVAHVDCLHVLDVSLGANSQRDQRPSARFHVDLPAGDILAPETAIHSLRLREQLAHERIIYPAPRTAPDLAGPDAGIPFLQDRPLLARRLSDNQHDGEKGNCT